MSDRQNNMTVWVGDKVVCIRIAGRASVHSSVEFKDVVQLLRNKGHLHFVLDLTDCLLMDSTFLGVLARVAIDSADADGAGDPPSPIVDLLNPNERVRQLLDTLGVDGYFNYLEGQRGDLRQAQLVKIAPAAPDRVELTRTSLEAHQTLMKLNPNNVPKFRDVARFLAEELKQQGEQRSGKPGSEAGEG